MKTLSSQYQSGDWAGEKHVPAIHAPQSVKAGEVVEIKALIGEAIPHPNTFEHHIAWLKLYFQPSGSNFPVEIATFDFSAHGESDLFTEPFVTARFAATESGTIMATSYCNIHGLWENNIELEVL